jgi:Domain of unknown function (DUF4440)
MKRCPQCERTYDDSKNFCLADGTPLAPVAQEPAPPPPPPPPAQQYPQQFQGAPAGWSQQPTSFGQPPAQQKPKGRAWPWVVGILGVILVGVLGVVGAIGYFVYRVGKDVARTVEVKKGPARRADVKTYVSDRAGFSGKLAEHYADFSFDYPSSWQLDPKAGKGTSSNFVKVERSLDGGKFTLENFAVGWYTSTGTMAGDERIFPQLVEILSKQFAPGFPGYKKVWEGRTTVGRYPGHGFNFTSKIEDTPRGDVEVFGRVVLVPSGSTAQRNGLVLIMLASSLADGITGADDVGTAGEMPVILESFRMGGDVERPGAGQPPASSQTLPRGLVGEASEGAPADEGEALEQLKGIEEEWARANIEGDRAALERILAAEYVTTGGGAGETRADYLKNLSPNTAMRSQTFDDLTVALTGGRAVLTGTTDVAYKDGRTTRYRFVDTFVWRDGRWQATASSTTQVN